MATLISPYQYFADPQRARPIFNGFIYIGRPDGDPTNPDDQIKISVICECGGDPVNITQPVRTGPGGLPIYNGRPAQINIPASEFSITLQDKDMVQIYHSPRATGFNQFSAENDVTHATRSEAALDTNSNRSFIRVGDFGGARYIKVTDEVYNNTPATARFTDAGMNRWILNEPKLSIAHLGAISGQNVDTILTQADLLSDSVEIPTGNYLHTAGELPNMRFYGDGTLRGISVLVCGVGETTTILGFDTSHKFNGDWKNSNNTLVGRGCGRELTTGTRNTALGQGVFSGNTLTTAPPVPTTGTDNIGIGFHALKKMESGSFNVGIGTDAGNETTTGGSNTCVGGSAGQQITIGFDNVCIGRSAFLRGGQDASSGDANTFIDLDNTGNIAIGRDAMRNAYDCDRNTVVGYQAMRGTKDESDFTGNFTGDFNCVIGYRALYTNPTSAQSNVIIGTEACREGTTCTNNVIIGHNAARDNTTGSNAVIIGNLSLRSVDDIDNRFSVANQSGTPFLDGIMGPVGDGGNFLRVDGNLSAAAASTRTCGTSIRPWTTVFSDNGAIQTSDRRFKTEPENIPDSVFVAWRSIRKNIKMWKWLHKTDEDARLHFGPIAQDVFSEFEKNGVDPFEYGFACSDPLFDEEDKEVIDKETGEQMVKYSLRQSELFMLEIAYNVWRENKD